MVDGIVITGPTASGKTALSIDVAQRLAAEIVSMDSRQVFIGMDIGTAKPTAAQRALVPHHGIDLLPPSERYSAGRFACDARLWLDDIETRSRTAVVVGGTGFFLRALTHPMFEEPPLDALRKEALKHYLEGLSREELLRWLRSLDEASATRLGAEGGRQRVARAVEIALLTGRPLSQWHRQQPARARPLEFLTFVLELPRPVLYARINERVTQMLRAGLVDEVRGLLMAGYDERAPGMNTTGYIELLPYLRAQTTLEEAADQVRAATRAYARRQMTWFRHQLAAGSVPLDATRPGEELAHDIVSAWRTASGGGS